jgi:hypothetical protein
VAQLADFFIGTPDGGKKIAAKELSKHQCVDAVSFDFGLGDSAGAEWIGNDDFCAQRLQKGRDGPAVGGGFQGDTALG